MLRSRTPSRSVAATLLLAAAACGGGDTAAPTAPTSTVGTAGAVPSSIISDATRNSGDPRFYWLAPIVKGSTPAAAFDANAQPQVSVCVIATVTADAPCVGAPVATFSRTTGTGSEVVRVDAAAEQYIVNFHTDRFDLDPAKTYRITVALDGRRLGFADLELADKAGELRNVNTAEYVPLLDGRTLPVKFSIRQGIVVPPTAVADAYPATGAFDRAQPVSVDAASGLLANDDLGVPAATIDPASIVVTEALGGTLSVQPDGAFSLSGATRTGTATFSYTIRNGNATSSTAAVTLLVGGAPTAVDDAVTVTAGETVSIDVLANDDLGLPAATLQFSDLPGTLNGGALTRSGGTLTLAAPTTAGKATVSYTLTNSAGTRTGTVTFTIVPGAADRMEWFSGLNQSGIAGQFLRFTLTLRIADVYNNPIPGRLVEFAASGDGATQVFSPITNQSGAITFGWRLSTTPGINTLTATSEGLPPLTYTTTGICDPNLPRVAEARPSTRSQRGWIASVIVRNGCGEPVGGVPVLWNSTDPRLLMGAILGPVSGSTDGSGIASREVLLLSGGCPFSGAVQATPQGTAPVTVPVGC